MDPVHAHLNSTHRALVVRHQGSVDRSRPPADPGHHLLGIAQLRDSFGMHKRCYFDTRHAGLTQSVYHLHLAIRGDKLRLDLKSIARPYLTYSDMLSCLHTLSFLY